MHVAFILSLYLFLFFLIQFCSCSWLYIFPVFCLENWIIKTEIPIVVAVIIYYIKWIIIFIKMLEDCVSSICWLHCFLVVHCSFMLEECLLPANISHAKSALTNKKWLKYEKRKRRKIKSKRMKNEKMAFNN